MRETWVRSLDQEDPLKKEMATHSSTLAWKIPWTQPPAKIISLPRRGRKMHSSEDRPQRTPTDTSVRPSSPKMDDTVGIKVTIPIFAEVFFLYNVRL